MTHLWFDVEVRRIRITFRVEFIADVITGIGEEEVKTRSGVISKTDMWVPLNDCEASNKGTPVSWIVFEAFFVHLRQTDV